MTNIRRVILLSMISGILAFAGSSASAQMGRGLTGEDRVNHMSQMLKLSETQKQKLRPIMLDHEAQVKKVDGDGSLAEETKRTRKKSIRQATDNKIKQILDPEQQQRFEQSKRIREKMGIE